MPAAVGDVAALVAQLQALAPAETGLAAWWSQCTALERLNAAVHAAGSGGDGASTAAAVVGAFRAAPQQLQVLVHALLVAEAWRERVLPHVVATQQAAQLCHYLARYHEAVVANLLEALLSHDAVVQAAPEDALFELADYGSRAARVPGAVSGQPPRRGSLTRRLSVSSTKQLVYLTTVKHSVQPEAACVHIRLYSGGEDARLNAALSGLTLVRLLAENADEGPPCIRARLLRAFDAPAALAAVLTARPWVRQRRLHTGGVVTQHLEGGAWRTLPPGTRPAGGIPGAEAHAWLALLHLLSPASTAGLDPHSVARSIAAAAHALTPAALEALPPLEWLSRAAQGVQQQQEQQHSSSVTGGSLLLSLVPPMREALLRSTDWAAAVAGAQGGVFGDGPEAEMRAKSVAAAQAAVWEETLWASEQQQQQEVPAGRCGASVPGGVRVDVIPPGDDGTGARGWHFELECDGDTPSQAVSLQLPFAAAAVTGLRWRLRLPTQLRRLVPVAVLRCTLPLPARSPSGATTQQLCAQLSLPGAAEAASSAQGRSAGEVDAGAAWASAPPVVWVTVGALASDGAVLQLRCARVEQPADVGFDADGSLLLYRPAGGALSVRN